MTTTATLDGARNVDSVTDPAGRATSTAYEEDERVAVLAHLLQQV